MTKFPPIQAKTLEEIDIKFDYFLSALSTDYDKEKIKKAYHFARKAHINQKRHSGEPYLLHPVEVSRVVANLGLDTSSLISALLHDVVEDTETSILEITREFGDEVALIVDGLTKITGFSNNKREEKIEALRKVLLASAKDVRILIVKLCDRLHNMRTLKDLSDEKKTRISKETMLIYVPIAQKIGLYSLKWELEDLAFKYNNSEMFQFIKQKINMKRIEREKILENAVQEVNNVLSQTNLTPKSVIGRPKNFYSIYKKIKNKAKSFEEIYDLYAIRVNVKTSAECYSVLGLIHEKFQVFPDRFKDYIANPKLNGYQSIHTTIFSKSINCPVELQIRTEEMHKLAEFGIAAHWRYKDLMQDKKFEKKISWLREVMVWEKEHKDNEEFMQLLKFDFFDDEIFVFTPKNDVHVLPEKGTVLDFAYQVHTDIGDTAVKAKVNGAITVLDTVLKSGDIVEIMCNKNSKPSEKWLKFVKTNKARIKIRQALNLKKSGPSNILIDDNHFNILQKKILSLTDYKKFRKARCCEFKYGIPIVGVINKDKELVIHNSECENAKFTINEKIELKWKSIKRKEITINLILQDRVGLLMDILSLFYNKNVNIKNVFSKMLKNGDIDMTIVLMEHPLIEKIEKKLRQLPYVKSLKIKKSFFTY